MYTQGTCILIIVSHSTCENMYDTSIVGSGSLELQEGLYPHLHMQHSEVLLGGVSQHNNSNNNNNNNKEVIRIYHLLELI